MTFKFAGLTVSDPPKLNKENRADLVNCGNFRLHPEANFERPTADSTTPSQAITVLPMSHDYVLQPFQSAVHLQIDYARELNEQQFAAVTAPPGPSLVIAGAGSGKTRTLTYRVAYLLEQGIPADRILLLTFTNKAAKEMMRRVARTFGFREDLQTVRSPSRQSGEMALVWGALVRTNGSGTISSALMIRPSVVPSNGTQHDRHV